MNDLNNYINDTISKNKLVKINKQLYLKQYQKEILDYYHIDYRKCGSISEILFLLDDVLDNEEIEDFELLEDVALSLQEFNYYINTNK